MKPFIYKLESVWFFYSQKQICYSLSHILMFPKTTKTLCCLQSTFFKVFSWKITNALVVPIPNKSNN